MERRGLLLLFFILFSFASFAQDAFQKKDLLLSGGLHLINYRKHNYDLSERAGQSVPFSVSAEYGVNHRVGVGLFSGYYIRKYRYNLGTSEPSDDIFYSSRFLIPGIKVSYHFMPLLEKKNRMINGEDWDVYASALLGFQFNMLTKDNVPAESKSNLVPGLVIGARYYLSQRWAVFGELGAGIFGIGNLGFTARL